MRTRRRTFGLITALFIAVALLAAGANIVLAQGRRDDVPRGRPFIGEPYGLSQQQRDDEDDDNDRDRDGGPAIFDLRLLRVSDVNGGTGGSDFSANNPGSDSLGRGWVRRADDNGVRVRLRGAQASSTYDVQFEHLQDHGRDDLGNISTDGNGNFNGTTPNGLGSNRVGVIVLIRDGHDQFVSAL
jgi:hypothetical protein